MGRKKLHPEDRRTRKFMIRFSAAEYKKARRRAGRKTLARYLRETVLGETPPK